MRQSLRVLLAALATLAVPATALAQPAPQIIDVSLQSTVQPGQDFTLTVRATNRGDPASNGSISVSFPDQEVVAIVGSSPVRAGGSAPKIYQPGQMIANQQKQSIPALYPLAELFVDQLWPSGSEKFLTIQVTAPAYPTTLRVLTRVTLRANADFFTYPPSGTVDQQGFPVLISTVAVAFPITATPVPTVTPTSVPTRTPTPTNVPTATLAPAPIAAVAPQPTVQPTTTTAPLAPTPATPSPPDPTPSAVLTLLGTLLIAGLIAVLAIVLTRRPRTTASAFPTPGSGSGSWSWAPSPVPTASVASTKAAAQSQPSINGRGSVPAGYEIVGPPKQGGMAVVYKALQPTLHRYVALKVLSPALGADPSFVERFYAEARHTASLEHPNIVPIYDVGEANGSVFIAMRYIDGLSLQELLAQGKQLPIQRAISIAAQVAEALDYAHGRGIIHRDVKPANIMIEPGDRATLTDFGIARVAGSVQLTSTGSIVGTPDYLSPEQARGADVDARTDLYALAVVTYEMLAGRPPFQSDNPLSVVHAQIATPPPPVTLFNPSVPREVADVLLRAMAKEPAQRFASCREFATSLRQAAIAAV